MVHLYFQNKIWKHFLFIFKIYFYYGSGPFNQAKIFSFIRRQGSQQEIEVLCRWEQFIVVWNQEQFIKAFRKIEEKKSK